MRRWKSVAAAAAARQVFGCSGADTRIRREREREEAGKKRGAGKSRNAPKEGSSFSAGGYGGAAVAAEPSPLSGPSSSLFSLSPHRKRRKSQEGGTSSPLRLRLRIRTWDEEFSCDALPAHMAASRGCCAQRLLQRGNRQQATGAALLHAGDQEVDTLSSTLTPIADAANGASNGARHSSPALLTHVCSKEASTTENGRRDLVFQPCSSSHCMTVSSAALASRSPPDSASDSRS